MLGRQSLAGLAPCVFLELSSRNEGHDSTSICTLFSHEGRNNGLEIVVVLPRNGRPVSTDFINNRIL